MIPKIIHYCWFGHNPLPELAEKCIQSWKKYCPDYQLIEWNEGNFNIGESPLYVQQAYEAKKWAFVSDYVRLKVVYEHGGIYLDTDVELLQNLDVLLDCPAFFGKEDAEFINTGLGFGAEINNPVVYLMLKDYLDAVFYREDGSIEYITCPDRNTSSIKPLLEKGTLENGILTIENAVIYPKEYFCPLDWRTQKLNVTDKAFSIHWYDASWLKEDQALLNEYTDAQSRIRWLFGKRIANKVIRILYSVFYKEKWKRIKDM